MSKRSDIGKRFLELAYRQLNPDISTISGLEQALRNWYCFQYNVPPNDDKLNGMLLEELLILNQMHKLRDNPALAQEIQAGDYEDWLKTQMGEDYVDEEEMIREMEEYERKEQAEEKRILEELPESIHSDFTKPDGA